MSSLLHFRVLRFAAIALFALAPAAVLAGRQRYELPQDTGFLNRSIQFRGVTYRYQVYLPEEWRRDDRKLWPIILFLHGRGERGSEGMWQTQVGLPQAVRDHPERWPFVIVMPQCPFGSFWTDPTILAMAMTALDRETEESHGDPDRTYLTGLSLGGYGSWELARMYPHRWAAVAIAAGGIFWSYAPDRWEKVSTLPAEYARAIGHTPVWLFHGEDDPVVKLRQSEVMYEAFKESGGRIRLWIYQGLKHDCWTRAYDEPELPRWLLDNHLAAPKEPTKPGQLAANTPEPPPFSERLMIPLHPPAIRLTKEQIDNLAGEYFDARGNLDATLFWQGDRLYLKNHYGEIDEVAAESPTVLFYPQGSSITRLVAERNADGRIVALILRDDRHEERWEKRHTQASR